MGCPRSVSGNQFLSSEARQNAGCLIADIRMPGMSDLELQAKLKGRKMPNTHRLHLCAWRRQGRTSAMHDGRVEFLTKPIDDAVVLEIVQAALGERNEWQFGTRTLGL